ncbi:helix-turn-helix transcriptional regulator [Virgibacillus sp. W0430]|uniref:helix-turn-helix transcriptional regulator n=1 Tax=Virgibacillus sp. W0430 TaxID=3391580 RepID=UPI003F46952A
MCGGENILILALLKILQIHSDEEHPLTQKEIIEILENDYLIDVDRKTVKDNMERLIRFSEQSGEKNIGYDIKERKTTNKETSEETITKVFTNFYYEHAFTQSELRLIIDSLLFSKYIPDNQRKELIIKLENLTSNYFDSKSKHILSLSDSYLKNNQLFYNIAILDEAISKNVKVTFNYNNFNVDENAKLIFEPRKNEDGSPKEYIINPYQMVAADGRYYLICNNDRFDNISHYRVDRITNIGLLETNRKSFKAISGDKHGLDLKKYMDEHIYMFSGESVRVSLRLKKYALNEFIGFFNPENIRFSDQTEDEVTARVRVNQMAMRNWALRYALQVKVLSPKSLVEEIRSDIEQAWKNYQ